jgi:hypothetical protein
MARLMAALAAYAVLALAAAETLTTKIPVGDHAVELRVLVWVILAGCALLTIAHRRDRTGSAKSGDQ